VKGYPKPLRRHLILSPGTKLITDYWSVDEFVDKPTDFEPFKSEFKTLNWFLIENSAFGRHAQRDRDALSVVSGISFGES
jgi:hypothetical protein